MAIQFEDKGARPKMATKVDNPLERIKERESRYTMEHAVVDVGKDVIARNAKKLDRVAKQVAAGVEVEAGGKTRVTMYLSDEVIAFFKALGPGYQTRIDDVLKRIVREGADRWLDER